MEGAGVTTVRRIIDAVAAETGVGAKEIMSDRRARRIARPRFAACWLARHLTSQSLPQIGRTIGRDHTTIMHALDRAEELRRDDPNFEAMTNRLLARLREEDPGDQLYPVAGYLTPENSIIIRHEQGRAA
jgi:chromosomal replication initiator protein